MKKQKAIVLGATGATGQELVDCLLEDSDFSEVVVFVRKKGYRQQHKLITHQIDFSKIQAYKTHIKGDVLFSCLGTTLKEAGSKDNQYLVDFTYQYEFAKIAAENKVPHYILVSSTGANEKSPFFYPKIKGKLEEAVKKLPFKSIRIFQPPTLIRQKERIRAVEKIGIKIFGFLNSFGILKSQKPLPVSILAQKMVSEFKKKDKRKISILTSKDLF